MSKDYVNMIKIGISTMRTITRKEVPILNSIEKLLNIDGVGNIVNNEIAPFVADKIAKNGSFNFKSLFSKDKTGTPNPQVAQIPNEDI